MYDAVVIGAGINGCCAALQLARLKKNVALVEQFPIPHSRGSSAGQSRIITFLGSMPGGDQIRLESFKEWLKIQEETGVNLLRKKIIAWIGNNQVKEEFDHIYESGRKMGSLPAWIPVDEFNKTFKTTFPSDSLIFIDYDGGVLMAEKCLSALQAHFKSLGGVVIDEYQVTSISIAKDGIITVRGPKGEIVSSKLIVCAGPWSRQVLKLIGIDAPLRTRKAFSYYWEVIDQTPFTDMSFVDIGVDSHAFGTPMIEYPGLIKVTSQGVFVEPNERDSADMSKIKDHVSNYVRNRMPFLRPTPVIQESCMYTDSPDQVMILDHHPIHKNIAYVCGFKGTGFKSAPVIGRLLSEMVLGNKTSIDIERLRMDRFNSSSKISSKI